MSAPATSNLLQQAGRAATALVRAQLVMVKEDAREDTARVLTGLALLAAAVVLLVFALVGAHAAGVVALAPRLGWLGGCGVVAGVDLALAVVLVLLGRRRLDRPFLAKSRELAHQTLGELRKGS